MPVLTDQSPDSGLAPAVPAGPGRPPARRGHLSAVVAATQCDTPRSPGRGPTAAFDTEWPDASTLLVSVRGGLDAANAHDFARYVLARIRYAKRLILNLSAVEFFGTAAFSAIHMISVRAAGEGVDWVLVPNAQVTRLLQICDPDGILPRCPDVRSALPFLRRGSGHLLQLVPQLR